MGNIGGTFWKYMNEGGPVMWVLLTFSVLALAVIFERAIALRRAKINVNEFLAKVRKALIVNRSIREAVKVCEQYRGPVASIMKAGLLKYGQPKEDVEKTIENAALFEMGRLERFLVFLATVANVAPLLGFFGTVTGMIKSFDALAAAGSFQPRTAVAIGIKEALTTTAARSRGRHPDAARLQLLHEPHQQVRARHRDRPPTCCSRRSAKWSAAASLPEGVATQRRSGCGEQGLGANGKPARLHL